MEAVVAAAGLFWVMVDWVFLKPFVFLPMRFWAWVWRQPLGLVRRISFIVIPWGFVGVLLAIHLGVLYAVEHRAELRGMERTFLVKSLLVERWFGAQVFDAMRWIRSPTFTVELGPLTFLELLLKNVTSLFLVSTVFGGPLWVPLGSFLRGPIRFGAAGGATVNGRPLSKVSLRGFGRHRTKADKARQWFVGGGMTGRRPVYLGEEARLMHTWVVGATGTGKTQSVLLPALRSDIAAGRSVVFIDGKGDRSTLDALWTMAKATGREKDFKYFDLRRPGESLTYSPLLHGSANEQLDKIAAALRWDNEYYRSASVSALLRILRALQSTRQPYAMDDLLAALSDLDALRELAAVVPEGDLRSELEKLAANWKTVQMETAGLRAQLESMLMSDFGPLLMSPQPELDLAEAYKNGGIVYFALPPSRFPETAPLVAKLVLADLNSVAGMVQDGQIQKRFCSVVIDEFAAFAMPLFIDLLNKARSAGMALTISHQSMRGDLANAKPGFIEQVAASTNVKICLTQNDTQDAEYVASLSGTYKTIKRTDQTETVLVVGEQRTGMGSVREVDEYRVSPNLVRGLSQGHAVVQVKQPQWAAMVDVVVLDMVSLDGLLVYEPAPRPPWTAHGVNLRGRVRIAKQFPKQVRVPRKEIPKPVVVSPQATPDPSKPKVELTRLFE